MANDNNNNPTNKREQFIRTVPGMFQEPARTFIDFYRTFSRGQEEVAGMTPMTYAGFLPESLREKTLEIAEISQDEEFQKQREEERVKEQQEREYMLQEVANKYLGSENIEMQKRGKLMVPSIKQPEGVGKTLTRGAGSFALSYITLGKLFGTGSQLPKAQKTAAIITRGEAATQFAFNPQIENFANMVGDWIGTEESELRTKERSWRESGKDLTDTATTLLSDKGILSDEQREALKDQMIQDIEDFVLDPLKYEEDDSMLEARMKLLGEGLIITGAFEGVLFAGKTIKTKVGEISPPEAFVTTLKDIRNSSAEVKQKFIQTIKNARAKTKGGKFKEDLKRRRKKLIEEGEVSTRGDLEALDERSYNFFYNINARYSENSFMRMLNRLRSGFTASRQGLPEQMHKVFLESQGTKDMAFAEIGHIARNIDKQLGGIFDRMLTKLPKKFRSETEREKLLKIIDYALYTDFKAPTIITSKGISIGRLQIQGFNEALKALPKQLRQPVKRLREYQDALSQRMIDSGMLEPEDIAKYKQQMGYYARESYELFEGDYFRQELRLERAAKQDVRKLILELDPKTIKDLDKRKAHLRLLRDLNSTDKEVVEAAGRALDTRVNEALLGFMESSGNVDDFFRQLGTYTRKNKLNIKRKEIPKNVKEFMGVVKDPLDRFTLSVTKMVREIEDRKFFNAVHEMGRGIYIFKNPEDVGRGFTKGTKGIQIPDGFGNLSGMWTNKEIGLFLQNISAYDTLVGGGGQLKDVAGFLSGLKGMAHGLQTVYSHTTQVLNVTSSYAATIAQGINPLSKEFGEAVMILAHKIGKTINPKYQKKVEEVSYYNLLGKNVDAGNIAGSVDEFTKTQRKWYNPLGWALKGMEKAGIIKASEKLTELYRTGDEIFKVAMWLKEYRLLDKINEALPNDPKFDKFRISDTKRASSEIVQQTLQNYDFISRRIQAFKSIPVVGQFFSFAYESLRTMMGSYRQSFREISTGRAMIQEGASEAGALMRNRGIKRFSSMAAYTYAAERGINYWTSGDDAEENTERFKRSSAPEYLQNTSMVVSESENGNVSVVPIGNWNYYNFPTSIFVPMLNRITSEDPLEFNEVETMRGWITDGLSTATDQLFSASLLMEVWKPFLPDVGMQGMEKGIDGKLRKISNPFDPLDTWEETGDWFNNIYTNGHILAARMLKLYEPGSVKRVERYRERIDMGETPYGEVIDPTIETAKLMSGFGGAEYNSDYFKTQYKGKANDFIKLKRDLEGELRRALGKDFTPKDFEELYIELNRRYYGPYRRFMQATVDLNHYGGLDENGDKRFKNINVNSNKLLIGRKVTSTSKVREYEELETRQEQGLSWSLVEASPFTVENSSKPVVTFMPLAIDEADLLAMVQSENPNYTQEEINKLVYRINKEIRPAMAQIPVYVDVTDKDWKNNLNEKDAKRIREYTGREFKNLASKSTESRQQKFQGGAISEDYPVPNVNLVPSERVDKNTGMPYEAEMERLGFKDGLLVSIGVAPVSKKQISKLKKSLKKRKAKANGGRIRLQGGSYSGDEQSYSLPVGTGASEDQRDPTEWQDYSARDPQMDPYRYGSQGADDYANWMDAQIARDEAYDYSEQRPDEGENGGIEPVIEASTSYQTNYDYFLPAWGSVVANAPNIFNRWLNKGRTGLIMSNTSQIAQNANGQYYIVPLYNTETGDKYESDEDMWNQVGSSIEDGTLAGYDSEEEAQIDRKKLYDTLIREHGLDSREDKDDTNQDDKERPKRKGGKTGGTVRDYDKEYANYHSSEKQKKDRAHRNNANRQLKRDGRIAAGDGNDVDHKDGNPRNNSPSNLLVKKKESNRSFSRRLAARNGGLLARQQYGLGDRVKKLIKERGIRELFDKKAVFDQSKDEWETITQELLAPVNQGGGGMTKDQLPSVSMGTNALNHLNHSLKVYKAFPNAPGLVTTGLGAKEMYSAISYAKPFEGKPFVGVRDSGSDSWNNNIAAGLAKIEEDKNAQARRRMDTVKNSIIRQYQGQPLRKDKDIIFFDYAADKYYHK